MSLLKMGLAVAGSTLVAKGAQKAFDLYAPEGFKSFLDTFGVSSKDVGDVASGVATTFFGGTAADPLDISDPPS